MIENIINDIGYNIEEKKWTIWDKLTGQALDLTDSEFGEGLGSNYIKPCGYFRKVENSNMIWIDGILDT
jgi:hypothetical protein